MRRLAEAWQFACEKKDFWFPQALPLAQHGDMSTRTTLRDSSLLLALLAICAFFALKAPEFLGARNLSLMMTELSITGTLAMGMLLVILTGHIDLSAGSGVGLLGGIASVALMQHDLAPPIAMLLAILAGVALWWFMGLLIVKEFIPAFITTLAGLLVFRGLFRDLIANSTVPVAPGGGSNLYSMLTTTYLPSWAGWSLAVGIAAVLGLLAWRSRAQMQRYGFPVVSAEQDFLRWFVAAQGVALFVLVTEQFRGVPLPAVILAVVTAAVYVLTQHTALGRHLYAVGGNEEAAAVSGVPVQRVVITAFAIMGAIVGITGLMQTAYAGSSTPTVGELMELDAIAACVIGGVSLRGGRGTVTGVLFGTLLMTCLLNGMTLLSVESHEKLIVRGVVLLLAAWLDVRLRGKS
jgi:D-xylose transport system permease protein